MNNRETPYRQWAVNRRNEIRSVFNKWKNKLQLKEEHIKLSILSPNGSAKLRREGWVAQCK